LSRQQKGLIAAALAALVCVFVVITVSVVDARRPLDRDVERSFELTMARLSKSPASVDCVKTRVDFYQCTSDTTPRPRRVPVTLQHTVWVTEDGCWKAFRQVPVPPARDLGRLATRSTLIRGCVADADR